MNAQRRLRQPSMYTLLFSLFLAPSLLFGSSINAVLAQDPFNCKVSVDGRDYDLTDLAGERTAWRERETPPTSMLDEVRFNLCADLKKNNEVSDQEQCAAGTRACLVKTNKKEGQDPRVISVIPLMQSGSQPQTNGLEADADGQPRGFELSFTGPKFPAEGPTSQQQGVKLTMLCANDVGNVYFNDYVNGVVHLEWSTPAGCAGGSDGGGGGGSEDEDAPKPPSGGDDPTEGEGSAGGSLGVFFLLLVLAFVGYFALGAYYNYTTYGASGSDLIPHRDFWREVPYMARDVVSHLCGNLREHRAQSRTGYISV